MGPTSTLAAAVVAAAATALVTLQFNPPAPPPTTGVAMSADVEALRAELAELRRHSRELETAPAAAVPAAVERVAAPEITDQQIEQALARYLAAHDGKLPNGQAPAAAGGVDVAATVKTLRGNSNYWNNSDVYKRLFAAGKMDEFIAAMEQFATQNPKDPQAQMDLGNAYLAYLQLDQTKWPLSMKADQSFDRVLALDENHWGARFTKAMSYTFWPDFMGKKKEAISHFERLVDQQDNMPARPEYAQTYFFLGNLLEQRGETERARTIWQRGLRLYPDNADLRGKVGQ